MNPSHDFVGLANHYYFKGNYWKKCSGKRRLHLHLWKLRSKYTSTMTLVLKCVIALRTKTEEKLPLDNIALFLLFEIARSYNLFNMTALSGQKTQTPKHRTLEHRRAITPKGQHTEGSKHWKVMIPVTQVWDRILYHTAVVSCHSDISYHCCRVMLYWYFALMHHIVLIYLVLISYTLIIMIHHPGIISYHANITSWWYIVWYHIIQYWYFNCWYNIIRIYRSHGNNLCYQNEY